MARTRNVRRSNPGDSSDNQRSTLATGTPTKPLTTPQPEWRVTAPTPNTSLASPEASPPKALAISSHSPLDADLWPMSSSVEPDYSSLIDFIGVDLQKPPEEAPWFLQQQGYMLGNGEPWVDSTLLHPVQSAKSKEHISEQRADPKLEVPTTSENKATGEQRSLEEVQERPTKMTNIAPHIHGRKYPGQQYIQPRRLEVKVASKAEKARLPVLPVLDLQQILEEALRVREAEKNQAELLLRSFDISQKKSEGQDPVDLDKAATKPSRAQYLKNYKERTKNVEETHMWGGPITGNGTESHEKFGMCGLSWRETVDFLKAPSVGGKPTIAVRRIIPGGSVSQFLVRDFILQYSLPEADFLGNYFTGGTGVLGELGIQAISHKLSGHRGRLIIDRTRLNGIFICEYRKGDIHHKCGETRPPLHSEAGEQVRQLDSARNWRWLLENFFVLSKVTQKEPQNTAHTRPEQDSYQDKLPPPYDSPSLSHITRDPLARADPGLLKTVLPSLKFRSGLVDKTGNLIISVPLNQGRFKCEWDRLDLVRQRESRQVAEGGLGNHEQAKWYLFEAPFNGMKWVRSSARNIYSTSRGKGMNKSEEKLTQADTTRFSGLLWLDLVEDALTDTTDEKPERRETRAARIRKNRENAQMRKDKHKEKGNNAEIFSEEQKFNALVETIAEVELKEQCHIERSAWDKLATGWVTEEHLDDPEGGKLYETVRKVVEEDLKSGLLGSGQGGEDLDTQSSTKGKEKLLDDEDGETYLVLQGCKLASKEVYGAFASTLDREQTAEQFEGSTSNISCSNLEIPSEDKLEFQRSSKIGITDDEPIPSTFHQSGEPLQDVDYEYTSWSLKGGVRELFRHDGSSRRDLKLIEQSYMVVLALVSSGTATTLSEAISTQEGLNEAEEQGNSGNGWSEASYASQRERISQPLADLSSNGADRERTYHEELRRAQTKLRDQSIGTERPATPASQPPEPIQKPHVLHQLSTLLASGSYKVVAIYPSIKACTYCNRVINPRSSNNHTVRCSKADDGGQSRSVPSLKGGQLVHAKNPQALNEGCKCNELRSFHEIDVCFGHCKFCSLSCKARQDEDEVYTSEVWARMVECFESTFIPQTNPPGSARSRSATPFSQAGSGDYFLSGTPEQPRSVPNIILNWPGGWSERGTLKRKREQEEQKVEAEKLEKKSRVLGVRAGMPLANVEYRTSEVFGEGWQGTIKKVGLRPPLARGAWEAESVWGEVIGGRSGFVERLYGRKKK